MSEHVRTLRWFVAYRERRADCSCGWVGSYYKTARDAEEEWRRHVESDRRQEPSDG